MAVMKSNKKKILLIVLGVIVVAGGLFYFVPAVKSFVVGQYNRIFKKKVSQPIRYTV